MSDDLSGVWDGTYIQPGMGVGHIRGHAGRGGRRAQRPRDRALLEPSLPAAHSQRLDNGPSRRSRRVVSEAVQAAGLRFRHRSLRRHHEWRSDRDRRALAAAGHIRIVPYDPPQQASEDCFHGETGGRTGPMIFFAR